MIEAQEKKSRRIALISSIGVHAVLLLLLLFVVAWRAPNPPLPEYGIELNFGTVSEGSGAVQPRSPAVAQADPEPAEEVEPLPVPETEEAVEDQPTEAEPEPVETEAVVPEVVSKVESPVRVEEKPKAQPTEQPREQPKEKVVESKPEPKPVPQAVYKPKSESAPSTPDANQSGAPAGQGDKDKSGDQGDPQGTLDLKALYGKAGGGGGGVSMTGFNGFGTPHIDPPPLPDDSHGKYVFRVRVDDRGYVISVTAVERGLSLEAERRLKAAIEKLQFIPKGTNLPPSSEGFITFSVVSSNN